MYCLRATTRREQPPFKKKTHTHFYSSSAPGTGTSVGTIYSTLKYKRRQDRGFRQGQCTLGSDGINRALVMLLCLAARPPQKSNSLWCAVAAYYVRCALFAVVVSLYVCMCASRRELIIVSLCLSLCLSRLCFSLSLSLPLSVPAPLSLHRNVFFRPPVNVHSYVICFC